MTRILDAPSPVFDESRTESESQRARRRPKGSLPLIVALGLSLFALIMHNVEYRLVSPIDEFQHIDALDQASRFDLVRRGERVGPLAMEEQACRGLDAAFPNPSCAGPHRPENFQEAGYNTAYIHSPAYYFLTGVPARAIVAATPVDSLVTAGRIVNIAWLLAALVAIWIAAGDLGAPALSRMGVLLLLSSTPVVLHSTGTITPDAVSLFSGAVLVAAVLRWENGRLHIAIVALLAALVVLFKATHMLAVGLIALYLVTAALGSRGAGERRLWKAPSGAAALCAGAGVAASIGWVLVEKSVALVSLSELPMHARFETATLSFDQIVSQVSPLITGLARPYIPAFLSAAGVVLFVDLANIALAGGTIAAALQPENKRLQRLALSAIMVTLAAGPFFVVSNFVFSGIFVGIPARYAMSLLPALAISLAAAARLRWSGIVLAGFGLVAAVTSLIAVVA